jgi:hypothetical protein
LTLALLVALTWRRARAHQGAAAQAQGETPAGGGGADLQSIDKP